MGSTPGQCRLCQVLAPEPRPDDHHLAIDWQFHQNVAQVHGQLGTHGWVEKAAVEPELHGLGIGRRLLESVAAGLQVGEPAELVLECAPDRAQFYAGSGYEVLSTFADPAGPDAYLMRRWIHWKLPEQWRVATPQAGRPNLPRSGRSQAASFR